MRRISRPHFTENINIISLLPEFYFQNFGNPCLVSLACRASSLLPELIDKLLSRYMSGHESVARDLARLSDLFT